MLNDLWTRLVAWTGTLIAPDWGALVALIPLLLLAVAAVVAARTAAAWATAGPARRAARHRLPVAPDGRELHIPVLGPLVLAMAAFVTAFGLVAGVAWFAAGLVLGLVGLAVWRIEARRARRRATRQADPPTTAR